MKKIPYSALILFSLTLFAFEASAQQSNTATPGTCSCIDIDGNEGWTVGDQLGPCNGIGTRSLGRICKKDAISKPPVSQPSIPGTERCVCGRCPTKLSEPAQAQRIPTIPHPDYWITHSNTPPPINTWRAFFRNLF